MSKPTTDQVPLTADSVTDQIRDLILNGSLGVGVQLKQEILAKRFGVSRIPVREALCRLESEGLVTHAPHQGSVVASRSTDELLEILDMRIGLESRALVLAIPCMTQADFNNAESILARYDASDMPREWTELNLEFHMCLYRPCNRPHLLKTIENLVRGVDIQLRAQQSIVSGQKTPQSEHRAMLKACIKGDVRKARDLLESHIERTQMVLRKEAPLIKW